VENEKRAQHHHRIAKAEHVRARPAGGNGEDVAEEGDVGALDEIRVRELARADVQAGGRERVARRGHHAVVRDDRDHVQDAAERNHPQPPKRAQIRRDAGTYKCVGHKVSNPVHACVAGRHNGDDEDLDGKGDNSQPDPPEAHFLQPAQPSSCHRDGEDEQEEGQSEGHGAGGG
jgi:hypothetical protein